MKECVTLKDLYKLIFYYGTLCNSESALPKYIFCFKNGVVVFQYIILMLSMLTIFILIHFGTIEIVCT